MLPMGPGQAMQEDITIPKEPVYEIPLDSVPSTSVKKNYTRAIHARNPLAARKEAPPPPPKPAQGTAGTILTNEGEDSDGEDYYQYSTSECDSPAAQSTSSEPSLPREPSSSE